MAEWTRRFGAQAVDRPRISPGGPRHSPAATIASAPTSIRWVDDMRTRWGSCTPRPGPSACRRRFMPYPDWVIDYVIVHELAHLRQPDHTPAFWALVDRYPRSERACGYLMAKSGDAEGDDW